MFEITLDGYDWYCACRRFPSGAEAKAAFEAAFGTAPGEMNLGVYRHQRIGLDDEPVLVSVVGRDREDVERADRLLDGGVDTMLHYETWLQLITRRLQVVIDLHGKGAPTGRYRIPHGEGERMGRDGRFPSDT